MVNVGKLFVCECAQRLIEDDEIDTALSRHEAEDWGEVDNKTGLLNIFWRHRHGVKSHYTSRNGIEFCVYTQIGGSFVYTEVFVIDPHLFDEVEGFGSQKG